jgi:alpha-D-ribose 1-methylphosphonate 5-triphosphate diphosphatase
MTEAVLTNACVVLRDRVIKGTVVTEDDRIVEISEGPSRIASAFDCQGDYLIPGLIELHTDNLERHVMPRPGAFWPSDAAVLGHDREIAAAGITTVFNALCVGEVHSRTARVELLNEMSDAIEEHLAEGALKVDHFFHWRCEVSYSGMIDLLEPLMEYKRLRLLSVMDHTPGQRQVTALAKYKD